MEERGGEGGEGESRIDNVLLGRPDVDEMVDLLVDLPVPVDVRAHGLVDLLLLQESDVDAARLPRVPPVADARPIQAKPLVIAFLVARPRTASRCLFRGKREAGRVLGSVRARVCE